VREIVKTKTAYDEVELNGKPNSPHSMCSCMHEDEMQRLMQWIKEFTRDQQRWNLKKCCAICGL